MEVSIKNIEFKSIYDINEDYKENICIYTILISHNIDLNLLICDLSAGENILGIRLLDKGNIKRFV